MTAIKNSCSDEFTQFYPMIQKIVWHQLRYYRIEKQELESEAFVIFCEIYNKYNPFKASFCTYLYKGLKIKLSNYCKNNAKLYKREVKALEDYEVIHNDEPDEFKRFIKTMELIDDKIALSNDAKEIVNYLLSREWETVGTNWKPRLSHIKKVYGNKGWKHSRILKAWNQIYEWWNGGNKDQFCMEV